jgi:hypothetical protein
VVNVEKKISALVDDVVSAETKIDALQEAVNRKPDREEFLRLLDKVLEYTMLKIEHEP